MRLAIQGPNKPHPNIAMSLENLGLLYEAMSNLDKALENHEKGLQMNLAILGPNTQHSDIAVPLSHIGIVCHKQKHLNRAAVVLQKSLEMLRAVHGRNSMHPKITQLELLLANVHEDQRRKDQSLRIREPNANAHETSENDAHLGYRSVPYAIFVYATLLCFRIPHSLFLDSVTSCGHVASVENFIKCELILNKLDCGSTDLFVTP